MSFLDVIDNLVPSTMPDVELYKKMYKWGLKLLNKIKCSRFNAMYFGSMQVGPDMYSWKDGSVKDFTIKYQSCCLYVMGNLYNKITKENKKEITEISLFILFSMLSLFVESGGYTLDEETYKYLEENDKYTDERLKGEFNGWYDIM